MRTLNSTVKFLVALMATTSEQYAWRLLRKLEWEEHMNVLFIEVYNVERRTYVSRKGVKIRISSPTISLSLLSVLFKHTAKLRLGECNENHQ